MSLEPGTIVSERYRLLQRLGQGAHGVVYRSRDLDTREEVAIKFLQSQDAELARRLEREAVAMARLRGTNAVYVHQLGRHGKLNYLVMEMLYGQDFEQFLSAAEELGGRLKPLKMLEILRPVVATLEVAHDQGIVHRDLKPSNIFLIDVERGGGVRLLDFGLVKLQHAIQLTAEGMVAGTPSYIAPEMWKGDPKGFDHRVDVFSLGVIVFRCLAGKLPQPSRAVAEVMVWASKGKRPSLHQIRPSLPPLIDVWMEKALAIEPDDRFRDVRAAWSSLESILFAKSDAPY